MRVVVLDDRDAAVANARTALGALGKEYEFLEIKFDEELSKSILPLEYNERISELSQLSGYVLVFVDLFYHVPGENRRLVREKYRIPTTMPDEISDGFALACALILNVEVRATIVVYTSLGYENMDRGAPQSELERKVQEAGRQDEIQIATATYTLNESRRAADEIRKGIKLHVDFFCDPDRVSAVIGSVSSGYTGFSPIRAFLFDALEVDHSRAHVSAVMDDIFRRLLRMKTAEFQRSVIEALQGGRDTLSECLKAMGLGPGLEGRKFSVVGAWLLALAAFREVNPRKDWHTVFSVSDLNDPDLHLGFLLPPQSYSTRKRALLQFYELCRCLFNPNHLEDPNRGRDWMPLLGARLNRRGLSFELDFPYTLRCGGRDSLAGQIEEARSALRQGKTWGHDSSGAICRFEIIRETADLAGSSDDARDYLWSLQVRAKQMNAGKEGTEVVFA